MKKHKLLILVAAAGLLGGCAATLTPTGEIYTEALLPVDTTVVMGSYPVVAYGPRPHYRHSATPSKPRGSLRHEPRSSHHRPTVHYGAPGQHRSPGQHRAPGVKGPHKPHGPGSFQTHRPGPQGSQAKGGPRRPSGFSGRPQGAQQNTRGSHHSRGPRR